MPKIIYTHTDEAPALATYSLLPIIEAFTSAAGVSVETRDISLAARIVAAFSDQLPADQQAPDALAELGEMAKHRDANIIKLPNISASLPQLNEAVAELQAQGIAVPDYPAEEDVSPAAVDVRARYDRVKGSAVNPVLREGNSDRRAPAAVKQYARRFPHPMGAWSGDSKTHVATMSAGDFRSNERSVTLEQDCTLEIHFEPHGAGGTGAGTDGGPSASTDGGTATLLKSVELKAGTVVDATFMSVTALRDFLAQQLSDAQGTGVLFSLHLKATMMKVSDPIIFGHCVNTYFADVFDKHAAALAAAGANPNNGLESMLAAIASLPADQATAITADIEAALASGPALAMVDSDHGITNLHVPSDVIVDASMPAMIRTSGQMWDADGQQQDTKAVIPDSSYAGVFQAVIDDCKQHGAFDPTSMGSVPNVGLMAQKAEEYGSHDKTFELPSDGVVRVVVAGSGGGASADSGAGGAVLLTHEVAAGDIWRMCTTNDAAIKNWVELAVQRGRATGAPVVFWLDSGRAHDAQLIAKVEQYLGGPGNGGSDETGSSSATAGGPDSDDPAANTKVLAPAQACQFSLDRIRRGEDTISATGNVLRDYNTDLFPILELGTSAKMLSIVPLMAGGGLFETGAGGSAPKHVAQFTQENHLRWDSLGEFLALVVSLEHLAENSENPAAQLLSETLSEAVGQWLQDGRSPSRKVNEPDNRASHYYLAKYWAGELAAQSTDAELAQRFAPLAEALAASEDAIIAELVDCQGGSVDLGGYYRPDPQLVEAAMRPSATLNAALAKFAGG